MYKEFLLLLYTYLKIMIVRCEVGNKKNSIYFLNFKIFSFGDVFLVS